jgi:hypothetical protein
VRVLGEEHPPPESLQLLARQVMVSTSHLPSARPRHGSSTNTSAISAKTTRSVITRAKPICWSPS